LVPKPVVTVVPSGELKAVSVRVEPGPASPPESPEPELDPELEPESLPGPASEPEVPPADPDPHAAATRTMAMAEHRRRWFMERTLLVAEYNDRPALTYWETQP
jgi:hypothetical protein